MERFSAMDIAADKLVDSCDAFNQMAVGMPVCRTEQSREAAREIWKEGITTATFFLRGPIGVASTVATAVMSELKPGESQQDATIDGAIGIAKALGTRAVFCVTGKLDPSMRLLPIEYNLPARAVAAGVGCRTVNAVLDRNSWNVSKTGDVDWIQGGQKVASTVFDPRMLSMDVAAMGIAAGFSRSANVLTRGNVARSPVLSTSITGSGFGFSSGAGSEIFRQDQNHERFDIGKTMRAGFTGAAIGGIAAIPGGMQAESEAVARFNSMNMGRAVQLVPDWRAVGKKEAGRMPALPGLLAGKMPAIQGQPALARNGGEHADLELMVENPPFAQNHQRLQFSGVTTEPVENVRPGWSEKVEDYSDFKNRAITSTLQLHRIYRAQGHDAQIYIPERHYTKLESVVQTQLRETGTNARTANSIRDAAPADIVDLLDGLPNSRLVRRIYLYGHDHPDNAWQGGYYSADANSQGFLRFFNPRVVHRLRSTMNHEWSHLVHYRFPREFETFQKANRIEDGLGNGYNARSYAKTDDMENFAVHMGEKLMHPDAMHLLEIAEEAPLRTAVLGGALRRTMEDLEPAERSKFLAQYQARAKFISDRVVPRLRKMMTERRS